MRLTELTTKNYRYLDKFLKPESHNLSTYALENICIWKPLFKIYYLKINGSLSLFFEDKAGIFMYLPPLGKKVNKETIDAAFMIMDKRNINKNISRIENVEEKDISFYQTCGYKILYKSCDYICKRDSLAALKGDTLKTKRNLCNYFTKHYKFKYLPFTPKYRNECIELYSLWAGERKNKYKERLYQYMLKDNKLALLEMFKWYKYLDYVGRVIMIDKKIKAFTFGFEINKGMFSVLYEIADLSYKGLAQFISRKLSQELKSKYINLMDDSGLENIRKVKLSYKPVKQVNSYIIVRKAQFGI